MNDKFDFTVQNDSAANVDLLKDGTHQKIADRLFDLITKSETKGLTIGLEGSWGSGKSTVVNLLRNKLEQRVDTFVFYIDSWAHEGDSLRRTFLESFTQQLEEIDANKSELDEIKNKISNRIITKNITTEPVINCAGVICSILLVFALPIGLLFVDKGIEHLWNGDYSVFYDYLTFGLILAISPIFAALVFCLCNFIAKIRTKDKKKKILPIFWTTDTTENTTNETTKEPEKTSIEFEIFFEKLLEVARKKGKEKIVCVIDNLDRINSGDALKIWSTLQIFVQSKNPKGPQKQRDVWIIVPYDETGLRLLWDKKEINENKDNQASCSKSFLDKNFQLRIDVPKMLFEGWEDYARKIIDNSLSRFDDTQRKIVLEMLKRGRKAIDDAPSPREIKTYVNQVGFLYDLHKRNNISLESLCFYVDLKYLKSMTSDKIKDNLLSNSYLSYNQVFNLFEDPENIKKELSAILFNVEKEKGMELLLKDPVISALENKRIEDLKKLVDNHEHAVFTLVEKILADGALNCSNYINTLLLVFDTKIEKTLLCYITKYIKNICDKMNTIALDDLKCIFEIACKKPEQKLLQDLSGTFVTNQQKRLGSAAGNQATINDAIDKTNAIYDIVNDSNLIYIDFASLGIEVFNQIAESLDVEKMPAVGKLIKNIESLDKNISQIIAKTSQTMPNLPRNAIRLGCCAGCLQWNSTLAAIDNLFEQRYNIHSNNNAFKQCVQILSIMQNFKLQDESAIVKKIVGKINFWYYLGRSNTEMERKVTLYLLAKYFNELMPTAPRLPPDISAGINSVKAIINQKNNDVIEYFCKKINATQDSHFIWALSKDPKRELIGGIIKKQLDDKQHWFFKTDKPFEHLINALSYFNDESIKKQLIDEFTIQVDSEFETNYADGFVEYIKSKCNNETSSCVETEILFSLYDCMKESFKTYVSGKVATEILNRNFIFSSNLKDFITVKIDFSSLNNKATDVAEKIKSLIDEKKWNALETALSIISKCETLNPPPHYTDVMRQPLKNLDAVAKPEQKQIIKGLCDFFSIDLNSIQNTKASEEGARS